MILDEKVGLVRRDQFASQIKYVPPELMEEMEKNFNLDGKQSKEFYEGLLTGYANSYVLINSLDQRKAVDYTGAITAFIAVKLNEMD